MLLLLGLCKGAKYCDQLICLCVCLSVCEHVSGTAGPILAKFCVQIPCGRGSVLLRRHCAMLCTSCFMADITFGRSGPNERAWTWHHKVQRTSHCETGAESDVYECLVSDCGDGHTCTCNCCLVSLSSDWLILTVQIRKSRQLHSRSERQR